MEVAAMLHCTTHNLKVNVYADGTVIHTSRFITDPHHLTPCDTQTTTSNGKIFASEMITRNGRTFREWSIV